MITRQLSFSFIFRDPYQRGNMALKTNTKQNKINIKWSSHAINVIFEVCGRVNFDPCSLYGMRDQQVPMMIVVDKSTLWLGFLQVHRIGPSINTYIREERGTLVILFHYESNRCRKCRSS